MTIHFGATAEGVVQYVDDVDCVWPDIVRYAAFEVADLAEALRIARRNLQHDGAPFSLQVGDLFIEEGAS